MSWLFKCFGGGGKKKNNNPSTQIAERWQHSSIGQPLDAVAEEEEIRHSAEEEPMTLRLPNQPQEGSSSSSTQKKKHPLVDT